MKKQKTLIYFGAHPDDETFGLGTTLAYYALAGVKTYYVCATYGEVGTVDPEYMKGFSTIAELRTAEMRCAAQELGLAGVIYLGYRDSGMPGAPDNKHPNALFAAPIEQVAGKMVKVIRELKPDVVITHDAGGGYGHPDHIAVHNAVIKAFYASNDPALFQESGQVFQPAKLYFAVRPRGLMRFMVRLMPLFGQNPHRFGRNKDIDLSKMVGEDYPVNAMVRLSKRSVIIRNKAFACHASQGGAGPRRGPFRFLRLLEAIRGPRDYFMREYPAPNKKREKDLFEGLY
jgi:N-acetyl-1-D-myo-inositol-2-amino-2-deoxy-alpha-D-glucopyranoside deacetylase